MTTKEKIENIICEILDRKFVPAGVLLYDLGADELDGVEIIMKIEVDFNIDMSDWFVEGEKKEHEHSLDELAEIVEKILRGEKPAKKESEDISNPIQKIIQELEEHIKELHTDIITEDCVSVPFSKGKMSAFEECVSKLKKIQG